MSRRDIYLYENTMNRYQLMEELNLLGDDINEDYLWQQINSFSTRSAVSFAQWFGDRCRLPGDIHNQFHSILYQWRETGDISLKQQRWLLMAILTHWQSLDFNARTEIQIML